MRRRVALTAAVTAVAGGLAAGLVLGLGSDAKAAPTKAEYFARVARICGVYGPQLDRIAPPSDVTIPGEVASALRRVIPLIRAENREVAALRPPKELAGEIVGWLALKRRALAALERSLAAAEAPNIPATAVAYLEFLKQARSASAAGAKIGFPKLCSESA